jgi:hypothetical protein
MTKLGWMVAAGLLVCSGWGVAQTLGRVTILDVPPPAGFPFRHASDEMDFKMPYTGLVGGGRKIYVRVFLNTKQELVRRADSLKKGECLQYGYFYRFEIDLPAGEQFLRLGRVIEVAHNSSVNDMDMVMVFEEGEDNAGDPNILKLNKEDVGAYFKHGVEIHVYATNEDRRRRSEATGPGIVYAAGGGAGGSGGFGPPQPVTVVNGRCRELRPKGGLPAGGDREQVLNVVTGLPEVAELGVRRCGG